MLSDERRDPWKNIAFFVSRRDIIDANIFECFWIRSASPQVRGMATEKQSKAVGGTNGPKHKNGVLIFYHLRIFSSSSQPDRFNEKHKEDYQFYENGISSKAEG